MSKLIDSLQQIWSHLFSFDYLFSCFFLLLKPFSRFLRRYLFKGGFRDGFPGLFCAIFDALNFVVRYFKLWEQTHNPPAKREQQGPDSRP